MVGGLSAIGAPISCARRKHGMPPKAMACVGGGNGCGRRGLAINPQANEDRLCACQSTIEIEQLYVEQNT